MISYKVLITLTVIFIISCSGSPTLEDLKECSGYLRGIGFSEELGYFNYCFAKQFGSVEKFLVNLKKKFYKMEELQKTVIDNIIKPFLEDNINYADKDLNDPKTCCPTFIKNEKHFWDCVIPPNHEDVKLDDPRVAECVGKITCTLDGKIRSKDDDGVMRHSPNDNFRYTVDDIVLDMDFDKILTVFDIEYGGNEFKNTIRSYYLTLRGINYLKIVGKWNEIKKEYFEHLMKNFKEKNESDLFFTTTKWCDKKISEAKAAVENKMAAEEVAEEAGHV